MLAPLHFLSIPLGIVLGIVFFDEVITLKFLLGSAIIVASTYYMLMREQANQ
jgi:drug/metabolite transporter (DMT)-like permease